MLDATVLEARLRPAAVTAAGWPAVAPSHDDGTSLGDFLSLGGARMNFERNAEIFAEDDAADYVYRLVSGCVRATRLFADGRRQIGEFHLAGDVFGLDMGATHAFAAEAVDDCVVQLVRRSALFARAATDPELGRDLWHHAAAGFERARERLVLLGRKTAQERLAAFLLEMDTRFGERGSFELPMSRLDVADYLGLTIETVSRSFSLFEHEGLIALPQARRVRLVNRAALGRRSGH